MATNSNLNVNSKTTFPDGFPRLPEEAIEFSDSLSEQEKQEWRTWLLTATPEQQQDLVETLHDIWLDQQKQFLPQNFNNQAFVPNLNQNNQNSNNFQQEFENQNTQEGLTLNQQLNTENQNTSFLQNTPQTSATSNSKNQKFYEDTENQLQELLQNSFSQSKNQTADSIPTNQVVNKTAINQRETISAVDPQFKEQNLNLDLKQIDFEEHQENELQDFGDQDYSSFLNQELLNLEEQNLDLEIKKEAKAKAKSFFGDNKYTSNPLLDKDEDLDKDLKNENLDKVLTKSFKNESFDFNQNEAKSDSFSSINDLNSKESNSIFNKSVSSFQGYQYSDQLRDLYQLYIDSQNQSANLEREFKQRQQEFQEKQAKFLNQVMQVLADTDELKHKSFEMNDRLIKLSKDIQHLSNVTEAKGGKSLQRQIDELTKKVYQLEIKLNILNRDFQTQLSDNAKKYDELSKQVIQATNNVYGPHSLDYKLEILEKRLEEIEKKQEQTSIQNKGTPGNESVAKNLNQLKESLKNNLNNLQADKQDLSK